MSCVLITPPEYEPDAGANPPPYIVWGSAIPAFLPVLSYNDADQPQFTVTVGDADVSQPLLLRFCARQTTDSAFVLVNNEKVIEPTPDRDPDRKAVTSDKFNLCTMFPGMDPSETRYLYVVVTDGSFLTPNVGCDVQPGSGSASAAWPHTCDKPKL